MAFRLPIPRNCSILFCLLRIYTDSLFSVLLVEWRGKTFPFSRGCSFYRLKMIDGRKQIVYVFSP